MCWYVLQKAMKQNSVNVFHGLGCLLLSAALYTVMSYLWPQAQNEVMGSLFVNKLQDVIAHKEGDLFIKNFQTHH